MSSRTKLCHLHEYLCLCVCNHTNVWYISIICMLYSILIDISSLWLGIPKSKSQSSNSCRSRQEQEETWPEEGGNEAGGYTRCGTATGHGPTDHHTFQGCCGCPRRTSHTTGPPRAQVERAPRSLGHKQHRLHGGKLRLLREPSTCSSVGCHHVILTNV
jgi:hypothetical protein